MGYQRWQEKKSREDEKARTAKLEEEVARLRAQVEQLLQLKNKTNTESVSLPKCSDKESTATSKSINESSTSMLPPPAPKTPAFEIFQDPTTKVIDSSSNSTSMLPPKPPKVPSFAIFEDETTNVQKKQNALPFEIYEESEKVALIDLPAFVNCSHLQDDKKQSAEASSEVKTEDDLESTGLPYADYSVNPIGFRRESMTMMLPSETEFIRNDMIASTPAPPGAKQSVSRVKKPLQQVAQPPPPPPTAAANPFGDGLTGKLSPIVETSREYKSSSSSSSSSAAHSTQGASTFTQTRRCRVVSGCDEIVNPFDPKLITKLMDALDEPISKRRGFSYVPRICPKIKTATALKLGNDKYLINDLRDEGAYAKVYAAQLSDTNASNDDTGLTQGFSKIAQSKWFALKVCRPANVWEFYVTDELHKRMSR